MLTSFKVFISYFSPSEPCVLKEETFNQKIQKSRKAKCKLTNLHSSLSLLWFTFDYSKIITSSSIHNKNTNWFKYHRFKNHWFFFFLNFTLTDFSLLSFLVWWVWIYFYKKIYIYNVLIHQNSGKSLNFLNVFNVVKKTKQRSLLWNWYW